MATERQAQILAYLTRHEMAAVEDLARLLDLSPSSVRRELQQMAAAGLVVRMHGGARLPSPLRYEPPYEHRAASEVEAKRAIAAAALRLVAPGAVIGLSGGTTCTELGRALRATTGITVVTNAVNVALELYGQPGKRLIVTGGELNQESYELVGRAVASTLQDLHLDLAFLGASGVDLAFGFSMSDEPEAAVGRAFRAAAARTIVLADHSKIGRRTFARFCRLAGVDLLITDRGAANEACVALQDAGLKVMVAGDDV